MGYYVGVQFSFSTNSLRRLQQVACQTLNDYYDLPQDDQDRFGDSYTKYMLNKIADNPERYIHYGNKGDMFIWGGVWNYYNAEDEIPYLKLFLKNCWVYEDDRESILFDFDRALLIVNREQSEVSHIYEFSWNKKSKEITIKKTIIELCWNQY